MMLVFAALLALAAPVHAQDWERKQLEKSPRHGEWVSIPSGGRDLRAFVVYPKAKARTPAIVVVHEIFGLTDWVRQTADALARRGYIAVAPDLLTGLGPGGGNSDSFPGADAARKAIADLDPAAVLRDLDAAADYAKSLPAADGKVSVIGFCWGGGQAFQFAAHRPDLAAAYVFYGPSPADVSGIKAPVYGFYAADDARINASLPQTKKAMAEAGKFFETVTYRASGHGFMRNGQAPKSRWDDQKARVLAWRKLTELLKKKS